MPKIVKIGPAGQGRHSGKVKCGNFFYFSLNFFIFIFFLPAPGDHIFARIDTVFASDDVFR